MSVKTNFLIIGANKAGTTSLFKYLGEHPQVFVPKIKEPMFFNYYNKEEKDGVFRTQKVIKSLKSYQNLFKEGEEYKMRGESSTSYLANSFCAENIFHYNSSMKLIAILRNPIDRAFSNYLMYVRWNEEKRSFSQALDDEINGKKLPQGKQYIYLGRYLESLRIFKNRFGDKQLKIILFEDLEENIDNTYKDICRYLEIDQNFIPNFNKKYNTNNTVEIRPFYKVLKKINQVTHITRLLPQKFKKKALNKPRINKKEKMLLLNLYKDEIKELSVFIDRDLSNWLK